ncbi:hypothetical protein [Janthinobacterium sp. B9-8]|uniref:hypothetical protein n=1 Tax=Janthinobacterium sp. B9-8 TaxID=1236179 RepID=UPI00061D21B6|nr:hypothetical protein [Janthinobacterium sp. B9-8]AMC34749.1 hypothetical protein VN23_09075 [Janthinobacterium sp. B9-8]
MSRDVINMVFHRRSDVFTPKNLEEEFTVVNPSRKTKRFLAAMKAKGRIKPAFLKTIEVEHVTFLASSFMERLYKAKRNIFENWNTRSRTLLMGPSDFEELMGVAAASFGMQFTASAKFGMPSSGGYTYDAQVLGLNVRVIPWMSGMLLLPEDMQ